VVVTEVARCPTAFGWYATVSAVKPPGVAAKLT
jgi:hypothetical protein